MPLTDSIEKPLAAERTAGPIAVFSNSYARLPEHFFARVSPTPVAGPHLIKFNEVLAEDLGLDTRGLGADALAGIFGGNVVPLGAEPIAQADSLLEPERVAGIGEQHASGARVDASASDMERHANKIARISNRASPLMETLGGCAIAASLVYGGYNVIVRGSTPGQFFSFLTAFMLAYEPAKRLARLNPAPEKLLLSHPD